VNSGDKDSGIWIRGRTVHVDDCELPAYIVERVNVTVIV